MGWRGGWVVALVLSAGCGSYEADLKTLCKRADENAPMMETRGFEPRQVILITLKDVEKDVKSSQGKRLLADLREGPSEQREILRKAMSDTKLTTCGLTGLIQGADDAKKYAVELDGICNPTGELREKLGAKPPVERLQVYEAHIAEKILSERGKKFVAALKDSKTPMQQRVEEAESEWYLSSFNPSSSSCSYARDVLTVSQGAL